MKITADLGGQTAALQQVFSALNADDRPFGRCVRSLSVGDVVVIEGDREGDGKRQAWTILMLGWGCVEMPTLETVDVPRIKLGVDYGR